MADEGVKYFPLYCSLDEKFELLEAEYGLKGFAVAVKLLQRIYGGHGYYCEWDNDIALIFAKQCGFTNTGAQDAGNGGRGFLGCADSSSQPGRPKNLIDQVVAASVRRGIFDRKLFEESSILTSRGIQRNFLNIARNRKKVEIRGEYLLLSDAEIKGNVVITGTSYVRTGTSYVSFRQSKGKESKVNKKGERARAAGLEEFIAAYPKPCSRHLTETAYAGIVLEGVVPEGDLARCAQNYAEACRILGTQERYIKNAENFLKDYAFEDYLPGKYRKPDPPAARNAFCRIGQNSYDFDSLERQLLGAQGKAGEGGT